MNKLKIKGVNNYTKINKDIAFLNSTDIKTKKQLEKFITDNFTMLDNKELSFSRNYDYSLLNEYIKQGDTTYHMRVLKYYNERVYHIDILRVK